MAPGVRKRPGVGRGGVESRKARAARSVEGQKIGAAALAALAPVLPVLSLFLSPPGGKEKGGRAGGGVGGWRVGVQGTVEKADTGGGVREGNAKRTRVGKAGHLFRGHS